MRKLTHRFNFEVGLAVQLCCLNIGETVRLTGRDDEEVSGDKVVSFQPDDVTNDYMPPPLVHKLIRDWSIRPVLSLLLCYLQDLGASWVN